MNVIVLVLFIDNAVRAYHGITSARKQNDVTRVEHEALGMEGGYLANCTQPVARRAAGKHALRSEPFKCSESALKGASQVH